jgi:glycoside/pentoside/hexuronide:cation symporter, GPH family
VSRRCIEVRSIQKKIFLQLQQSLFTPVGHLRFLRCWHAAKISLARDWRVIGPFLDNTSIDILDGRGSVFEEFLLPTIADGLSSIPAAAQSELFDTTRPLSQSRVSMNSSTPQPAIANDRLKTSEYVGYALGDTASNFFFKTFSIFLTYYYVDVWGIPDKALLWMMPIVSLIGAFIDPIMGLIADRTNTHWGKFRPYLLWGAIPYGIFGYLMFAGPDLNTNGKILYAFVTYTLMLTSYSVINVPYSSLLGVVSSSSRTRAVASSCRFVGAFTGTLLISLLVRPLVAFLGGIEQVGNAKTDKLAAASEMVGFQWTMAIFAVTAVIMFWITFATTKERVTPPPKQKTNVREELGELFRNWPWVMLLIASVFSTTFIALQAGSTLFYFKYVVGNDKTPIFLGLDRSTVFLTTGALGLVLGTACLGSIVRKIDKKYCAATLSAITGLCLGAFFFLPPDSYGIMLALNALAQFCAGPTSALTWALYGDVADYGEWKFGRRSTGLIYSASLFAIKTGVVVSNFLLPLFLASFGYVKDVEQTPTALLGITLAFTLVPGFFALLKAGALFIYPLNQKRVDEIERELVARRAATSH